MAKKMNIAQRNNRRKKRGLKKKQYNLAKTGISRDAVTQLTKGIFTK